jgi:hypothetical protein
MNDVLNGTARWQVEEGDCLHALAMMPEASADMVLCDLPYGTTRNAWDSVIPLDRWWSAVLRVAKPNAAIVLFAQSPFDKVLGASRLDLLRYEWIWEKGKASGHLNAKRAPLKAHENVLVFYRRPPTYNPQKERVPADRLVKGARRHKPSGIRNYGVQHGGAPWTEDGMRYPRTVLRFPSVNGQVSVHPTQKPADLCAYLVRTYTNAGAVVLDPTCGSGSTGVGSLAEDRRFVGVERDPAYVEIARRRCAEAAAQPSLAGAA